VLAAECGRKHRHGELIVWFYAFTGLRARELSRLELRDVNTLHHWLTARRTKNGPDHPHNAELRASK
jgi:integrase